MKKNIYTDTLSKISTPDEVLTKGLESIRSAEPTNEVINFKEARAKLKWFKPLSVVAAVLALIIGLNTIGVFNEKDGNTLVSNPFIITAYAQELNTESYVKVGDVGFSGIPLSYSRNDVGGWNIEVIAQFVFNVNCVGENIETVTYSTGKGVFGFDDNLKGLIDYNRIDLHTLRDSIEAGDIAYCTFDYDNQPQIGNADTAELIKNNAIPLSVSFYIPDAQELYDANPRKYDGGEPLISADRQNMVATLFNDSKCTYTADVTAAFTDGTTATQTLEFKCEKGEDGYYFAAKIVETPEATQ